MAETILEHKAVIADKGCCWWGWWKRPLENARIDAWRQLQDAASLDKPAVVGLFDSGTGSVYRAEVIGVILPTDEAAARV